MCPGHTSPVPLSLAWRRKGGTESNGRGQREKCFCPASPQTPDGSPWVSPPELGHHEAHHGCLLAKEEAEPVRE